MDDIHPFYTLQSDTSSLVIDCRSNAPAVLYWGTKLSSGTTPEMLAALGMRQEAPARPAVEAPISLSPEYGAGFPGSAGMQVHRNGRQWAPYARIETVCVTADNRLTITSRCSASDIAIVHRLELDRASNVLVASTEVRNTGDTPLALDYCAAPTIPVPPNFDTITGFEGRWAREFQTRTLARFPGCYLRENRSGRTSHDSFPGLLLHEQHTSESDGDVYALHLGWSGNHSLRVEQLADGRAYAQFGEWLFPGELSLAPGKTYRSPRLFGVHSSNGFSVASQCLHRFVRTRLTDKRVSGKPKPVHFNTWEALYFDLSVEALRKLADVAADVGVERFVLDDGWFRGRRSDAAGLGDWYVDDKVFPQGLSELTDHVIANGMEFGLWIEPEMVSPDSDLYRAHPDWILSAHPAPLQLARQQLVLDLTRTEVRDHLFERISALLSAHPISYLKWDMNRDISQPSGHTGRAAVHHQTLALYGLLEQIRNAYPDVEIESCSSGGGRADFGVLAHTDRIWTSDNNDALDRLRIQRGFSLFFPAEVMGSHVGPRDCHVTGRRISMATRCGVALFGDMGIEADLMELDEAERVQLKAAVDLHKRHRKLIFSGDLVRLDTEPSESSFGIVANNQREALFSYALITRQPHSAPGRYYFRNLLPDALYDIRIIWPESPRSDTQEIVDGLEDMPFSGAALMNSGMQLPIMRPQDLLVLHLQARTNPAADS